MEDYTPIDVDFPGRLLHQAALWDNAELLEDLLRGEHAQYINSQDSWGRTPLHAAAITENSRCLDVLLSAGANPNIPCGPRGHYRTSLHICAEHGHSSNIEKLLEFNADLMITDNNAIGRVLNDRNRPLKERFRALFTLKNVGGSEAIEQIHNCFKDDSALLKHELAYCLGQMQDAQAIPILIEVLKDITQEPMVRHEAGEALGAIGDISVIPVLEEYSKDSVPEVAETCQLALRLLQWLKSNDVSTNSKKSPYMSVDPAPPTDISDIQKLKNILLNEDVPLFERYQAMFSLRNICTPESILALSDGLKAGSALFRHEIAFVLGQLQEEITVPYLRASLEDENENEMVRHECAEALGSIATPDCFSILNKYLDDSKRVVRESCIIALDMCEYENSSEFQYADTLCKVSA